MFLQQSENFLRAYTVAAVSGVKMSLWYQVQDLKTVTKLQELYKIYKEKLDPSVFSHTGVLAFCMTPYDADIVRDSKRRGHATDEEILANTLKIIEDALPLYPKTVMLQSANADTLVKIAIQRLDLKPSQINAIEPMSKACAATCGYTDVRLEHVAEALQYLSIEDGVYIEDTTTAMLEIAKSMFNTDEEVNAFVTGYLLSSQTFR